MMDPHLFELIEDAALNAWPSPKQMVYDGWLMRFTGGPSKRVNSVNIRYPSTIPFAEKICFCEDVYAKEDLPTLFRLPAPFSSTNFHLALQDAGYQAFDETFVLYQDLSQPDPLPPGLTIKTMPISEWLPYKGKISDTPEGPLVIHEQILRGIVPQMTLLVLFADKEPIACGMGVAEGEFLGYFTIYTHHDFRRKGYASVIMDALTAWGLTQGARIGYLQVEGDNDPARTLYAKLGFDLCYAYEYYKKGS
jgi:GNAT superfamily N-acetyltransferase